MKKLIFIIIGTILLSNLMAQDSTYYWYKGQKRYLEINNENAFLLLTNTPDKQAIKQEFTNQTAISVRLISETSIPKNLISSEPLIYTWAIIENSQKGNLDNLLNETILYSAPFLKTKSEKEVGISHLFYVKLKRTEDYPILRRITEETKVEIILKDRFMPLWYTLSCTKESQGNSLEMANLFYETGLFSAAEPNFIGGIQLSSVNDEYFDDQWGLDNTGQYGGTSGIDINISDAWDITNGDENITVAVVDRGIQTNHPDLTNLSPYSYDTYNDSSPSQLKGSHGISVSGIISADANNTDGIAGIASGTLLMTISDDISGATIYDEHRLANGIEYAVDNGADVINISWIFTGTTSGYIDDAIDHALQNGRGGLGCVVVCGSGNFDSDVLYPANSNLDIIVVGAINPIGKRKTSSNSWDTEVGWGSNYGDELDFVAPGVLVPTLDLIGTDGYNPDQPLHEAYDGTLVSSDYTGTNGNNYTIQFNGTSAATPHVSGVAALVLSANNGLSYQEVTEILASTATKVGGYSYQTSTERPNWTWNENVGYGLVNAGAAVTMAVCNHLIESTSYTSDITISGCSSVELEDVTVEDDAILTIEDVGSISIDGPFEAEVGSQLVFDP